MTAELSTDEPIVPFETARLVVREAREADAPFVVSLWRDPRVTRLVGFPTGIPTSSSEVIRRIPGVRRLDALLIAELRATREPIGQCMLGAPDDVGICDPDIKLDPSFWGRGHGTELWTAMVDRLFRFTSCAVVRGTPHVANTASIRMQASAGMRRVGEDVSTFPESMQAFTAPVTYYIYEIARDEWQSQDAA
jgi:RimJ/RimL family protein N-acetyltransferase